MSPEYLDRDCTQEFIKYEKHDVWAIGVITFQILTLQLPFNGKNSREIQNNIINEAPVAVHRKYDQNITDFIRQMLDKNPDGRPSIQDLVKNSFI